ncbi:MAG: hypothetical protein ABIH63_00700 [archaeon]
MGLKKGYYFSFDALIAVSLIIAMLIIMPTLYVARPEKEHLNTYSEDIVKIFSTVKVKEIDNDYLTELINNGSVRNENATIIELLGEYWAAGNGDVAKLLANNLTYDLIPSTYNVGVAIGGDLLSDLNQSEAKNLASYRRMISGIMEGEDITGYASRVFLTGLNAQSSAAYTFFGGYVGDGIITQKMELPEITEIKYVYMEMDAGNNFELFINDKYCDLFNLTVNESMRASSWYLNSSCFTSFVNGENLIKINFTDNTSNFIGGGYIKVAYQTSELNLTFTQQEMTQREWLPGIQGIINLYTSFYAPGNISNITLYLHYINNYTTYVNIGNTTVYESDGYLGETTVVLENFTNLNYPALSQKTVPLRIGTRNLTLLPGEGGRADVVLITDRTGSMTDCDVNTANCTRPDCNWWSSGCQNRRKDVALDADKSFVNTILTTKGNTVGLIGYGERAGPVCDMKYFNEDNISVQSRIEDYNYNNQWQDCGWTCISCGVDHATTLLMEKDQLHDLNRYETVNPTLYHVGDDGPVAVTENFDLEIDQEKLVKVRLTIFARNVDVSYGYRDCIYFNNNYIGQICDSNEVGVYGWHTCLYDLKQDIINNGTNSVKITGGNVNGCEETAGSQDDWDFKDVTIEVWHANNSVISQSSPIEGYVQTAFYTRYVNDDNVINISEVNQDKPNPVDFSNGMQSTGNTFGPGAGDDGWDWASGTYTYTSSMTFNGVVNGKLEMYAAQRAQRSGAYGIQIYVPNDAYQNITAGKKAEVSLDYEWYGNPSNPFESSDQAWIKGRWYSPTSGYHWLGSQLDTGDSGADAEYEIDVVDNPDMEMNRTFIQDITSWIEGPGWYYLDFGGKISTNQNFEWGYFRFDNIAVRFYNETIPKFNLTIDNNVREARLEFEAMDVEPSVYNCIYINDNYLGRVDHQMWSGVNEWQNVTIDVPTIWLRNGENTLMFTGGSQYGCNRTGNQKTWILRNINLSTISTNESIEYERSKSMLIMSDGEANTRIGDCHNYGGWGCSTVSGWETPSQETIRKACEAHNLYNISIYAVAFGNVGSQAISTLNQSACCDNCDHFYTSNDAEELVEIYKRIAQDMVIISFAQQGLNVTGNVTESTLYPDSYIEVTYTPTSTLKYGNIPVPLESLPFGNNISEGIFEVPTNVNVLDVKVTSYSSDKWTDYLSINNATEVYRLWDYGNEYTILGDPYFIQVPVENVNTGNNTVRVSTGITPQNYTGGSPDSKVLFKVGVDLSINYSDIYGKAEGCTWYVEFEDGSNATMQIPSNYTGNNTCVYYHNGTVYTPGSAQQDSINSAVEQLFKQLDFDQDSLLDVNIDKGDLQLEIIALPGVPYLWGPTIAEVRTWQ